MSGNIILVSMSAFQMGVPFDFLRLVVNQHFFLISFFAQYFLLFIVTLRVASAELVSVDVTSA